MSTLLHHNLAGITLPRGLIWVDEFAWQAPVRAVEYSLTGALVIDSARRAAGRPITLEGSADQGWVSRSQLQALYALLDADDGTTMPLQLADGRQFSVRFAAGEALKATAIARAEIAPQDLPYVIELRLITT
jgi:hypothetical protein